MSGRYLIDTSVLVFSLRLNSDVDKNNLTLVARDHHFNWVAELTFEQW